MEIFNRLWESVSKEWHVILQAKKLFFLAVVLLVGLSSVGIWTVVQWHFSGVDDTQRANIAYLETQLRAAVANAPTSKAFLDEVQDLHALSKDEFLLRVFSLTKQMREFEISHQNDEQRILRNPRYGRTQDETQKFRTEDMEKYNEMRLRLEYEWQVKFRGRVLAIYEEIRLRLGITGENEPIDNSDRGQEARGLLRFGSLAGILPISTLADYLESWARKI